LAGSKSASGVFICRAQNRFAKNARQSRPAGREENASVGASERQIYRRLDSKLLQSVYGVGMSTTNDPKDKRDIINRFIADPDASSILRQALEASQENSTTPIMEDAIDPQVENATDE
jgi:hypothetical protein